LHQLSPSRRIRTSRRPFVATFISHHKHDAALIQLSTSILRFAESRIHRIPPYVEMRNAHLHHRHSTSEVYTRVSLSFLPQDESTRAHVLSRSSCNMRRQNPRKRALIAVPRDCASSNDIVRVTAIDVMY